MRTREHSLRTRSTHVRSNPARPFLCVLVTAFIGVLQAYQIPATADASAPRPAFNKNEMVQLLKLETPDSLLIPQIRTIGLDFVATRDDLDSLKKMGASPALIAAIREAGDRLAARTVADNEAVLREAETLLWTEVEKKPDREAFESYLRRFPGGPNASLARQRLQLLAPAIVHVQTLPSLEPAGTAAQMSIEERAKLADAPHKAKGYLVANIISIRESSEDAIVGRRDNGDYFRATVQGWDRLGPTEVKSLPQTIKDDLASNIDHPLVWLVSREHLYDKDFSKNYNLLVTQAGEVIFSKAPGVIVTFADPSIPDSDILDSGQINPSKVAFYALRAAAPNVDALAFPTTPVHTDFSYKTTTNIVGLIASHDPPRIVGYYFKDQKMRVDDGNTNTIIDLDAQTIMSLDDSNKTYTVRNFSDLNVNTAVGAVEPKIDIKETGQKKTVNGFTATEVIMTIEMDRPQTGKLQMEIDMWRSADVVGSAELREFFNRNAANLPWSAMGFPWSTFGAEGNMALRAAMADAYRKLPSMNGVTVEQIVRLKSPALGQASGRLAEATAQRKGTKRATAIPPPAALPAVTWTMDSIDFSTTGIADSVFAVPAGYRKGN